MKLRMLEHFSTGPNVVKKNSSQCQAKNIQITFYIFLLFLFFSIPFEIESLHVSIYELLLFNTALVRNKKLRTTFPKAIQEDKRDEQKLPLLNSFLFTNRLFAHFRLGNYFLWKLLNNKEKNANQAIDLLVSIDNQKW